MGDDNWCYDDSRKVPGVQQWLHQFDEIMQEISWFGGDVSLQSYWWLLIVWEHGDTTLLSQGGFCQEEGRNGTIHLLVQWWWNKKECTREWSHQTNEWSIQIYNKQQEDIRRMVWIWRWHSVVW